MNNFEALNLIALKGAVKPDAQSNLRFILRWYSKTFHTPLHQVGTEVPIEDVWLAFYEERYHGMDRTELQEHIDLALETPEDRRLRLAAEEAEEASEENFKALTEKAANPTKITPFKNPAELLSQVPNLPETKPGEAPDIPVPPMIEPDITMEFIDSEDMEKLLSGGNATETKTAVDPGSFR